MNSFLNISAAAFMLTALFASGNVAAGPGHDHGDGAAVATAGKASPRFEAHSDLFEAVGVLGGSELSIVIDRYASNEPVLGAKVELESGSVKAVAQFHADHGDYSFSSKPFEKPGSYPITLTITAGDEVDILAGNLVVPDPAIGHDHTTTAMSWKSGAVVAALLVVLGIAATLFIRRRSGKVSHV